MCQQYMCFYKGLLILLFLLFLKLANDQCAACDEKYIDIVTTEKFGEYMDEAIQRIKNEIPRVLVNVVGGFSASAIYNLTFGQEYCRSGVGSSDFRWHRTLCSCFEEKETLDHMEKLNAGYDNKILEIYNKYKGQENENFAMRFTPPLFDIGSMPLETIRYASNNNKGLPLKIL